MLERKPASSPRRATLGPPQGQRARLLAAVGAVVQDGGSGSLTVHRVCVHAGMSRRTFYQLFTDIDDALASAVEEAHAELWTEVDRQLGRAVAADWPTAISTVVVAFISVIERQPVVGWLCVGEQTVALPRARVARGQLMSDLAAVIADGHRSDACAVGEWERARAAMGVIGALWELVRQHLVDRESDHPLRALAGPAIFLVLAPYIGRGAAMRLATHPPVLSVAGRPPAASAAAATRRLTQLARQTLLFLHAQPQASNVEIGDGIGVTHASQTSRHLSRLADQQLIACSRHGRRNAWSLTERGAQLVTALGAEEAPEGISSNDRV